MDKPFNTRIGFTRRYRSHDSVPGAESNQLRPYGPYGAGQITEHPVGFLVVAAVWFVVLYWLPPARLFLLCAAPLGALVGLILWLRHR